jgi:hypothetical protein
MRLIEIRSGLRKLEFAQPAGSYKRHTEEALVEFVRNIPLRPRDTIRVELGVKEGLMRELIGKPTLINKIEMGEGSVEYHYRLHAPIVATARASS